MDVAALLGWLALAVALNTSVTAILAVLTIRSGLGAGRADPGRRATVRAAPGLAAGPGPVAATERSDPLAGAIDAFLGRSDGLFRAGGPPPGQLTARGGPPRQAVRPGQRSNASVPAAPPAPSADVTAPASPAAPAVPPEPAASVRPQPRQPMVSAHDRPLSEVTWATSRPSRFVPSGLRPAEDRGDADDRGDATTDAGPSLHAAAPDRIGRTTSDSLVTAPAGRSASRVSIALAGRDGSGAAAGAGAVARLGPVIGGFIRERTRANDNVSGLTGGRYNVVLPDTSLDGAAALIQRLTQSCDAWLAAEQPPLRLEFGLVDLPAFAMAGVPATTRASGPERRRAVAPGA